MPSKDECLLLCRSFSRGEEVTCQWFSYDLRQNICFLLYSCPELDENFVDYVSGQVNCQNPTCKNQNFKNNPLKTHTNYSLDNFQVKPNIFFALTKAKNF